MPDAVRAAKGTLRATPVTYFNVGVRGALGVPDHWVYVPEAEWPMYRVGSVSNAVPTMAPPGHSSLYIELADRTTPPEALVPRVTEGLIRMGFIDNSSSRTLFESFFDKGMAIIGFATNGKEEIARLQCARVDGNIINGRHARAKHARMHRCNQFKPRPERHVFDCFTHAAHSAKAARIAS